MNPVNLAGKRLFITVFLFSFLHAEAQISRLDSLKKNIDNGTTGQLHAILTFCDEWESFNPDTLYRYALLARQTAVTQKDQPAILQSDYYLAAFLFQKNRVDTALKAIDNVLARAQKSMGYNDTLVKYWTLRGNILQRTAHYDEALKQNLSMLALAEQHNDTLGLIRFSTSIGNVDLRLKKEQEALKWHYRALSYMRTDALKSQCSFVYINLSVVYYHLAVANDTRENEDSIEINLQRAIRYSRQGSSLTNLANSLSMYGQVLAQYNKLKPAEAALAEARTIRRKIGDVFYEITDIIALSSIYENNQEYGKAIATCLQALDLANKSGRDFSSMISVYSILGEIYSRSGDYKKYSEVLNERLGLQDSVYKVNSALAITEMETKYDVQKKENTIIRQNYDLAKKNYLAYGSLLLLGLGGVFSFILIRQNRKKQALKLLMEQRMSAIAVAAAEENERRRIAAELHDNLGGQLSYISSNMDFILDSPVQLSNEEKNKRLGKVKDTAKNTISDLRETIWALKRETVETDELADKLKAFVQNQLASKPDMLLEVKEKLDTQRTFTPSEALNIFRIFQEAINNAVKYSDGDYVCLCIETGPASAYAISLEDNGKGFDTTAAYAGHYGLENMKERSKELRADLLIRSGAGGGTFIRLSKTAS